MEEFEKDAKELAYALYKSKEASAKANGVLNEIVQYLQDLYSGENESPTIKEILEDIRNQIDSSVVVEEE